MSWIMDALDIWLGFTQPYARLEVAQAGFEADRVMDYCPCCGSSVGRGEVHVWKDRLCCTECRYRVHAVSRVIRLGPYCSPLRPWILQIKFHRWEPLAKELGRCLAQQVRDRYRQQAEAMVVVPIPMSPWRHLVRGIDHTHILAQAVAKELGAPLERPLSVRWGCSRRPQAGLSSSLRRRMPATRWRLSKRLVGTIRNRHILLIDDVLTTGATLNTAAGAMRAASPRSITAAVLAVSDRGRGGAKISK